MTDYERFADEFMRRRSNIGASTVREWAGLLPAGATVLDLGCGSGVPITSVLIDCGLNVCAVEASPSLVSAFRQRFSEVPVECSPVEQSPFFDRTFDGAVAWGLMFLLAPGMQEALIRKVAAVLRPGGRFLFTSPSKACTWNDAVTGQESVSLGRDTYIEAFEACGLMLETEVDDEGENHYYSTRRNI
jgi:cyclopropane fatty-acyl-phospholipid synthase-like methyltransferase